MSGGERPGERDEVWFQSRPHPDAGSVRTIDKATRLTICATGADGMDWLAKRQLAVWMLAASACTASIVLAQQPQEPVVNSSTGAASSPVLAEIETELATLEADRSLDDSQKGVLVQQYQQAIEAIRKADSFAAETVKYRQAIRSGPAETATLRAQLDTPQTIDDETTEVGARSTEELRNEIAVRRVRLTLLREELAEVDREAARTEGRPLEISVRLPELELELNALREQLASETVDASNRAEWLLLQARETQLAAELEMLQYEQQSQAIRRELLKARQAVLKLRIATSEAATDQLSQVVEGQLADTAERVRTVARSLPADLLPGNPAALELAAEVEALADELEQAVESSERSMSAASELEAALEKLVAEFTSIRQQLQLSRGGTAMVQVLFALDRRCSDVRDNLRAIPVPPLAQVRLAALWAGERLREQPQDDDRAQPALIELVEARHEVLEELDRQYAALVQALALLEQRKQQYVDQADAVRKYIAEQLFGFGLRACPAISVDTFTGIPSAVTWQLRAEHRHDLALAARWAAVDMPLTTLGALLLAAVLLLSRRRIIRSLEGTGARSRRASSDRWQNTGRAFLWTLLLAIPVPLVVLFAGWTLQRAPDSSDWLLGLSAGLQIAAWVLLVAAFFSGVVRPNGLGAAHFDWNQEVLDRLRSAVFALMAVYVPALLITVSCTYGDASEHLASLGRVSFMVAHLWMIFLLYRWLYSARRIPVTVGEEAPGLLARWRPLWSALLLAAPLALVVLAAAGYLITAIMLSLGLLTTLSLIAAGSILYGAALRWFRIRRRKLARAEALDRREAAAAENATAASAELVETASEEDMQLDLEVVADQTRDLLRTVFQLGTLTAVLAYWSLAFPLDELADGVVVPLTGGLTLLQLAVAILTAMVTWTVVSNLSGLLELTVLRSRPLLPGTRHAIATLCRYGVTAIGAAMVLGVLQVDWAKFGWIAAALSVGLGFGLQEVVANFVSGLILLFERPLRVGDIVTVEGMTGTVTNIQMRATTVTNWDRQEFVVPNKTLITNTLLNWTLSEPLNRIVIPVGVAYGSDTELARQILLEVAADHPGILDEPEPMTTFEQFADSSLNLTLRAFLPDMESRLATITDLHTEIDRRFKAAGIEIAFPQLDLHMRPSSTPTTG